MTSLFFDEIKDKTLDFDEKAAKLCRKYEMEKHCVLIEESLLTYLLKEGQQEIYLIASSVF